MDCGRFAGWFYTLERASHLWVWAYVNRRMTITNGQFGQGGWATASRRGVVLCALAAGLALGLGACAGGEKATEAPPVAAGERGPRMGLEVAWWVIEESVNVTDPALGPPSPSATQLIARYAARPVPVTESTVRAWHESGLRLVAVPVAELAGLREQLRPLGPNQQQWIGQTTQWVEVARGRKLDRTEPVRLDSGELRLPAGSTRLLLRSWVAPAPVGSTAGAVLQTEVVPQHVSVRESGRLTLEDLTPKAVQGREQEGAVFQRLLLETALDGADAILIVPESPGRSWSVDAGAASEPGDEWDAGLPEGESAGAVPGFGPPVPDMASLGEMMFTDRGTATTRAVIVLIPRVPAGATPGTP